MWVNTGPNTYTFGAGILVKLCYPFTWNLYRLILTLALHHDIIPKLPTIWRNLGTPDVFATNLGDLWIIRANPYPSVTTRGHNSWPVTCPWLSKVSANKRRRYMCNILSHCPRSCSVIDGIRPWFCNLPFLLTKLFKPDIWLAGSTAASQSEGMLENPY